MFIPFCNRNYAHPGSHAEKVRTSTSFLLLASLAFSSIGVKPSSLAQRWALVVFPMPGGPVISTARNIFVPFLPGFLKPHLRLCGLPTDWETRKRREITKWPIVQPLLKFLDLGFVSAYFFKWLRCISSCPKLRGKRIGFWTNATVTTPFCQ